MMFFKRFLPEILSLVDSADLSYNVGVPSGAVGGKERMKKVSR